jgi:tRNA dimethylallyltransferase
LTKALVITGPTASGKSQLALDLAEVYPMELVSADSMQVYRYMDIGTDKATPEQMRRVRHHLIDIKYPDEDWSVSEFQVLARKAVAEIAGRGRLPCIVGGTGFYIRAFLCDYPLREAPPDKQLRQELKALARRQGNAAVHDMLKDIDPESYSTLHPNDLKRVIRAIEYYRATNRPISERKYLKQERVYDSLILGIQWDRKELYERIDNRVDEQFNRGLVQEVLNLVKMGYTEDLNSMQGLGYKEVIRMLKGLATEAETRVILKRNTRRFAKRQLTWFSKEEGIIWLPFGKHKSRNQLIEQARRLIDDWLGT